MGLKIIAGTMLGLWLIFVLMGKGGFAHMLLLFGISTFVIDLVSMYRARNSIRAAAEPDQPAG